MASKTNDNDRPRATPAPRPASCLEFMGFEKRTDCALPLRLATVAAGFPSPADDFIDRTLDLNEYLVRNPAATFFVRVHGDSMRDAGLLSGDILVVDRSLTPNQGAIIIAAVNGELTVKRIRKDKGRLFLAPENPDYRPIEITEHTDFEIWGMVTYVIHKAV